MELFHLPDWALQGGAVGLLGVVFLLIMSGRLVPSRFYKQMERDRDEHYEKLERERDYWRDAALKQQTHTEALLPSAYMSVEFMRGVQAALGGGPVAVEGSDTDPAGPGGEDAA